MDRVILKLYLNLELALSLVCSMNELHERTKIRYGQPQYEYLLRSVAAKNFRVAIDLICTRKRIPQKVPVVCALL